MRWLRRGLWGGVLGLGALCVAAGATAGDYSWIERQPAGAIDLYWDAVSLSSDGRTVIAGYNDGRLYTSTNSGVSWLERQPAGDVDLYWNAAAASGDGQILLAASAYEFFGAGSVGQPGTLAVVVLPLGRLYASSDGGQSWTEQQPAGDMDVRWGEVACSADGQTALAGAAGFGNGRLYATHSGPGTNWQEVLPAGPTNYMWEALACSGDGSVLAAGSAATVSTCHATAE